MSTQRYFPGLALLILLLAPLVASAQDTTWFVDVTSRSKLDGVRAGQISALDVNADGWPDLLLQNLAYNRSMKTRLLLNVQDPASSDPKDRIFVDHTDSAGVYVNPQAGVTGRIADVWGMADVNNDGHPDIVTALFYYTVATFRDSGDRAEVLLNDGTGRFRLVANNGLHELGKFPCTGISFLDYDLDGTLDIYLATFSADHQNNVWIPGYLLKGNGDGTFVDVTAASGIDQVAEPNYGATITDWNNDGWPDILTCPYCRTDGTLWMNNGDGTFTNATELAGYTATNGMKGNVDPGIGARDLCQWEALPADYDNDGDMDVAQMLVHGGTGATEGRSPLSINAGAAGGYRLTWDMKKFHRPGISSIKTWSDTLRDANGNDTLIRNFRTPSPTGHLGDQAGSWVDLDNDMLQDILISTTGYDPAQDRLFVNRQNADHSFTDIARLTGLSKWVGPAHSNRPFDYDLDGDDDFAVVFAPLVGYVPPEDRARANQLWLVRNDVGNRNNHVTVRLKAPGQSNRNAIGARIYVHAGGITQMREVQSGVGRWGMMSPFDLNFGLGRNDRVDSIVVRWPMRGLPTTSVVPTGVNRVVEVDGTGVVTGVAPAAPELALTLAPNPTSDWMTARLPESMRRDAMLEVVDALGRLRSRTALEGAEYARVPVEELEEGYYVVRVVVAGAVVEARGFVRLR